MTAMRLKRYPSASGGIALGKMGVGATMMKQLPYDAEVEYLESTGTQYIDTGILANGNFDAKYEVMINSISSESDILAGARSATQHLNFGQFVVSEATIAYLNRFWKFGRLYTNVRYAMDVHLHSGSQYIIVNGVKQGEQSYTGTELLGISVYIFKRHHYASDSVGGLKGRMYFFSLWQNGVLVRDYIPVRVGTTGAMYDKRGVGGMNPDGTARNDGLYFNQGTGDFIVGPDINAPAI